MVSGANVNDTVTSKLPGSTLPPLRLPWEYYSENSCMKVYQDLAKQYACRLVPLQSKSVLQGAAKGT